MKIESFRASHGRGGGGNWIQTRIDRRERYNESPYFFNSLMKRKSFRASRVRRENLNSDEDYFRKRYNESSFFFNDLWKIKSFRASHGRGWGGTWIQTRIKSLERYNESSSFSDDLMSRKSFHASYARKR